MYRSPAPPPGDRDEATAENRKKDNNRVRVVSSGTETADTSRDLLNRSAVFRQPGRHHTVRYDSDEVVRKSLAQGDDEDGGNGKRFWLSRPRRTEESEAQKAFDRVAHGEPDTDSDIFSQNSSSHEG